MTIFGKKRSSTKHWTDFDKAPKEIFSEACQMIADELKKFGFTYSKNNKSLAKKSQNNKFTFKLVFGTSHYNKRGQNVNLNISFQVISDDLMKFRKKVTNKYPDRNLGIPNGLVTTINFGYILDNKSYLDGSWELLNTHPKDIANQLIKYALPSFHKFEDIDSLIQFLRTNGQAKEFQFEFMTLDFAMCYGEISAAIDTLKLMLIARGWTMDFIRLYTDLENGKRLVDHRSLLIALIERAFLYGLKIKN